MLPKLLFSELSWTVTGYVNFARDLYHLLAYENNSSVSELLVLQG